MSADNVVSGTDKARSVLEDRTVEARVTSATLSRSSEGRTHLPMTLDELLDIMHRLNGEEHNHEGIDQRAEDAQGTARERPGVLPVEGVGADGEDGGALDRGASVRPAAGAGAT